MIERLRAWLARLNLKTAGVVALVALVGFILGALLYGRAPDRRVSESTDTTTDATVDATTWTCAMHPQIRQSEPGQCPICGMDLIPVAVATNKGLPPERLVLTERAKALAELRTTEVRRQVDPASDVRLLGLIQPDETASKIVAAWIGGRIDRLHVRVTGERVQAEQTIATLYSPEVLAAHQDLIAARRQVDRMQGASDLARAAATAALEAARDRLRLLGLTEKRLEEMETANQPIRQIAIRTPFAGTVIERLATEGAYVSAGDPLYRIADLSRVWVQLDAYEQDLPALRVGQTVQVEVESLPGESFKGKIAFIEPTLDPQRRTARVRVEVANRSGRLRPGLFARAVVEGRIGVAAEQPLVIPRTAPLFTGRRSVVYVEVPNAPRPTYEARIVRLGPRAGDVYPVVAGLVEGERVVIRGAFVLDADLQIRGGASMMTGPDDSELGPWDQVIALPAAERHRLRPVMQAYLDMQKSLAKDDLPDAQRAANVLAKATAQVRLTKPEAASQAWQVLAPAMREHAQLVARAKTLETARGAFEALSTQMKSLLRRFGNPMEHPLKVAFCPMASGQGANWIQEGSAIDNPFFGNAHKDCGSFEENIRPDAYLPQPAKTVRPAPVVGPEEHRH